MADTPPTPDWKDPQPPHRLEYARPNPQRDNQRVTGPGAYFAQAAAGFGACAVAAGTLFAAGYAGFSVIGIMALAFFNLVALLVAGAILRYRWPGFLLGVAIGALIPVGLLLLAIGYCFVAF